ncbi:hypothetical protein NA57DRAFT_36379 [Rhizodiscina lignyota]|uniref:DNA helicase n=1 Tax=Rhizodiscina lignyota TaxID=1504668 RepID=A0A9P4M7D3_9PEZI|nr:hypothetical protein NA57DRAFT_36379 [Rhizodiscina lignyota]
MDLSETGGFTNGHNDEVLGQSLIVENGELLDHDQNGSVIADDNLKKRKRTHTPNSRAVSRGPSPPWKLPVIDGPSTFSDGGKRRSARTNELPLELQPGADTRRHTLKPHASRQLRPTRRPSESNPRSPLLDRHQSSSSSITYSSKRRRVSEGEQSTERQQKRVKTRQSDARLPPTPSKQNGQHVSTSSPSSGFKIRLRGLSSLHKPPRTMNPRYVAAPPKHGSFAEWLAQDDPFEDDPDVPVTDEEARELAKTIVRLEDEGRPGGILSEERCLYGAPDPAEEPPTVFGHWQHVVNHALNFRKLLFDEKRKHTEIRRKIAAAASQAIVNDPEDRFAKLRPKVSEEDWAVQQKNHQLKRYRQIVRDLAVYFDRLRKEVDKKKLKEWEEQERLRGKKAMDEMLEKSTNLLEQRRMRLSSEPGSEADDDSATSANEGDDDEDGTEEEPDSDMMSESEDDENEPGNGEDNEEDELDQEQLRLKYADILGRRGSHEPTEEADEDELGNTDEVIDSMEKEDHVDTLEASANVSQLEGPLETPAMNGLPLNADVENIKIEEVDSILSEDDDMDSGSETESESDGESEGDEEEEEEEEEEDDDDDEQDEYAMSSLALLGGKGYLEQLKKKSAMLGSEAEMQVAEVNSCLAPTVGNDDSHTNGPIPVVDIEPAAADEEVAETLQDFEKSQSGTPLPLVNGEASTPAATSDKGTPTSKGLLTSVTSRSATPRTRVATPKSKIDVSQLLRGTLREYQQHGLEWLAGLHAQGSNGILADEMGLGKTIQTIALLVHVALHDKIWGPHLIVVPTSVMLNWEMEFKKWAPGFKVLTYYGSQEERKRKRAGWGQDDMWNVVITSYQMVVQDISALRLRPWHYLVLDEAHQIKNYQTQKWQKMLNMRTEARLLLTGTPLQNNLSELWSLLFFIMPSGLDGTGGFAELEQFTNAMKRPADQILAQGRQKLDAEAQAAVAKLHEVLRPYLLRRLKADVEKQMPGKYEHIVYCRLSKRQRQLYDAFMGRADTKRTLASGNYMSIVTCLMSLKKVCNHPDLFEERQIVTSYAMPRSAVADYEIKDLLVRRRLLHESEQDKISLDFLNLNLVNSEKVSRFHSSRSRSLEAGRMLADIRERASRQLIPPEKFNASTIRSARSFVAGEAKCEALAQLESSIRINAARVTRKPVYGSSLIKAVSTISSERPFPKKRYRRVYGSKEHQQNFQTLVPNNFEMDELQTTITKRSEQMHSLIQKFSCTTPAVVAQDVLPLALTPLDRRTISLTVPTIEPDPFHEARIRQTIAFPDARLLQYDCGKLQQLANLLQTLKAGNHRALIFTQMTKVLDILEQFLNIHGHRYLRLDGATPVEQRQILTERFNARDDILCFILSSRSGGLGLNLTGADTVIFYDLDWNPAMDKQCQDRCHRIGQTRDVHIYRFVSEYTIEANILRKSNQKRLLDEVIIQKGEFTTDYFNRVTYKDALGDDIVGEVDDEANAAMDRVLGNAEALGGVFQSVEDKEDATAAMRAQKEVQDIEDIDEKEQEQLAAADENGVVSGEEEDADQGYKWSGVSNPDGEKQHIDDYMLAVIEKETKTGPIQIPAAARDKKAARKAKDRNRRR